MGRKALHAGGETFCVDPNLVYLSQVNPHMEEALAIHAYFQKKNYRKTTESVEDLKRKKRLLVKCYFTNCLE